MSAQVGELRRPDPVEGGRRAIVWSDERRRLGACLLTGLIVALMTGPSGTSSNLAGGFRGSWLNPRVVVFLLAGALLWAAFAFYDRYAGAVRTLAARGSTARSRYLGQPRIRFGLYVGLLLVAILYPPYLSPFWQTVLVQQIGIYVLLAIGLNVVVGFAGLLDLGYIAFYAIGAYSAAYWTGMLPAHPPIRLNMFLIFPLAVVAAMIAGVVLGTPTLRLRGDYLAIVTLGFGEIITIVVRNLDSVTNGPRGAAGLPHFAVNLGGLHYDWGLSSIRYYYLLLAFVLLVLVAFHFLEDSRVGRAWTAIREDEVAAAASGVPTLKYKVMAFAIGASTSGFAGVIFASNVGYINPQSFLIQQSILVLVLVIFGGMGSIWGALLGAAVLQWLPQFLRGRVAPEDLFIYFGALLVVMMIFRPQGILPSRRRAREIRLSEAGVGEADAMSAPPGGGRP